jgi:CO/xanthine dehydrogenase Mo-binding subunit
VTGNTNMDRAPDAAGARGRIGERPPRSEGREKVTGAARYIDDVPFTDGVHGATVRSPAARGRITRLELLPGVPWDEIVVVTAADLKELADRGGKNTIALIEYDQPALADGVVNHPEEPVALLGHPDKAVVEKARSLLRVHIEPLPPLFDMDESLAQRERIWREDNLFKEFTIEKGEGSIEEALAAAPILVEGEYETGAQEQLYIEPNGMAARASLKEGEEGVVVWGSMQCPYYVHKAMMALFGLPPDKVRVVQAETGGGFGGKEEYPSMLAAHAALLSWKAGRPAKIIYDRLEDMVATTKRHPSRTRIRSGFSADGKLLALDVDFRLDGGAYMTLSPVVLSRGGLHASGPYSCPSVRVRARAAATNHPPHGAFRGFGAPQSVFAIERHLDEAAARLGLAPEELRRRNLVRDGETLATGQVVRDGVDLRALLDRALEISDYHRKRAAYQQENEAAARAGEPIRRGIGLATFMHGAGFTGSGERMLQSVVAVDATPQGRVRVRASSTEIGQGTNTVFSQIAAEALSLPLSCIEVVRPDTAEVPNSGPTVASRTVMVVGGLVARACAALRGMLREAGLLPEAGAEGYGPEQFASACAAYHKRFGSLRAESQYQQPSGIEWDDKRYRGDAYATYAWACYVAEVQVDLVTFESYVTDFFAVQEIGRVVHPTLAAGQIEGGVAQAVGYALSEKVVWREGRMQNGQMTNYIMPTSLDVPDIRVEFFEAAAGPEGGRRGISKGIGELPMDGTAPAILAAVEQATGVCVRHIPMTPEDLMKAGAGQESAR